VSGGFDVSAFNLYDHGIASKCALLFSLDLCKQTFLIDHSQYEAEALQNFQRFLTLAFVQVPPQQQQKKAFAHGSTDKFWICFKQFSNRQPLKGLAPLFLSFI